jgi:hypothetical protein
MDKFEQRLIIKFLFIRGLRSKRIHTDLETILVATVYSLAYGTEWVWEHNQEYVPESTSSHLHISSTQQGRVRAGDFLAPLCI